MDSSKKIEKVATLMVATTFLLYITRSIRQANIGPIARQRLLRERWRRGWRGRQRATVERGENGYGTWTFHEWLHWGTNR
jgi:hypothetical protein